MGIRKIKLMTISSISSTEENFIYTHKPLEHHSIFPNPLKNRYGNADNQLIRKMCADMKLVN